MAGYRNSKGKRSTRTKLLIYQTLVQEPKGLTTQQLFNILQESSVARFISSPAALAQTIRVTKGVETLSKEYTSTQDGQKYVCTVWVMADPKAFLDWYGEDI